MPHPGAGRVRWRGAGRARWRGADRARRAGAPAALPRPARRCPTVRPCPFPHASGWWSPCPAGTGRPHRVWGGHRCPAGASQAVARRTAQGRVGGSPARPGWRCRRAACPRWRERWGRCRTGSAGPSTGAAARGAGPPVAGRVAVAAGLARVAATPDPCQPGVGRPRCRPRPCRRYVATRPRRPGARSRRPGGLRTRAGLTHGPDRRTAPPRLPPHQLTGRTCRYACRVAQRVS